MSFKPKFTITNKILNNITIITSARDVIEQSGILPKWEAKLRRQAILTNSHSSTAIEGNRLDFKQVEDLLEGKNIIATEKDKNEVLNYLEAMEKIPALAEKGRFSTQDLLNIHRIITKGTMKDHFDCGAFRKKQVFVGRRIFSGTGFREEVEYMPPKTEDVPGLVDEFIQWLNLEKTKELNPVLLAGIVHYEIARIHPFIDGNGRTARLLATLILYLSGFDHRQIFALDDYYDKDRQTYYGALKTVDKEKGDLTKWLEYFTDGVAFCVNKVKEDILKLGIKVKKGNQDKIYLTERQMKILEFINKNGKITTGNIAKIFNISRQAALKEIGKLVKVKIVSLKGEKKGAFYSLS